MYPSLVVVDVDNIQNTQTLRFVNLHNMDVSLTMINLYGKTASLTSRSVEKRLENQRQCTATITVKNPDYHIITHQVLQTLMLCTAIILSMELLLPCTLYSNSML